MSNVIQYMNGYWLKRTFKDEEELNIVGILSTTRPYKEVYFQTYSADPYSDDYSNLDLEEAREAQREEAENALYIQQLIDGGVAFDDSF